MGCFICAFCGAEHDGYHECVEKSIADILEEAKNEAVKLMEKLDHTNAEKRIIATGFIHGYISGFTAGESYRKRKINGAFASFAASKINLKN